MLSLGPRRWKMELASCWIAGAVKRTPVKPILNRDGAAIFVSGPLGPVNEEKRWLACLLAVRWNFGRAIRSSIYPVLPLTYKVHRLQRDNDDIQPVGVNQRQSSRFNNAIALVKTLHCPLFRCSGPVSAAICLIFGLKFYDMAVHDSSNPLTQLSRRNIISNGQQQNSNRVFQVFPSSMLNPATQN
jgi:hypothetical protein